MIRRLATSALLVGLAFCLSGCLLSSLVAMPLRVVGAAASVVPVAGGAVHGVTDAAASAIDSLPF